jgi:predicted ribosome quality control (RQC) complex YloA/Tae2 family protein
LSRALAGRSLRLSSYRIATAFARHYTPSTSATSPYRKPQTSLKSSEVDSGLYVNATDGEASWESGDGEEFDVDAEATDSFDDNVDNLEEEDGDEDEDDQLMQEFSAWSAALDKALNAMERKHTSLRSELKKAEDVEKTVTRAQLIVSNLYLFTKPSIKTAIIQDWENDGREVELILDPQYDSASAEADALFAQARKLKRGSRVIGDLLQETENLLESLRDAEKDLNACLSGDEVDEDNFRLIQNRLQRTSSKTKFCAPSEDAGQNSGGKKSSTTKHRRSIAETCVRRLKSPGGCIVWVGRNRRGNEYLSFQVARGNDIWMHARGCPGAHIILQKRRGSPEPSQECLEFCANLAVFYSDARNERKAAVTAADSKHLIKPRGAPLGAVKLREELFVLTGWPDQVPAELKLARDECGQTDEFRAQDKAKRLKRTQNVAKQIQAKRREQKSNKRKARRQETAASAESEIPFDPY